MSLKERGNMSANNYLIIKRTRNGKTYKVLEMDSESKCVYWIAYTRNLETACLKAQNYMINNDVEYGCMFDFKEIKKKK
jgi:hypothetical protein